MTAPLQPPTKLRVLVRRRDRVDPERHRELVRLLRALLDKPSTPEEGRRL